MMDGFWGTGEEGGDRARNAVMTATPVHHCSFSQSGSHYFLAVAKMLLNGRVECEGESRSYTHNQLHFPLSFPLFQLTVCFFYLIYYSWRHRSNRWWTIFYSAWGWDLEITMLWKLNGMIIENYSSLICLLILDPRLHTSPSNRD